jgi:endonuclease YncB( thermonuclease family)
VSGRAWTYRSWNEAAVERVIDGDTVELAWAMDLGFGDTYTRRRPFRLLGIDAPDADQPEAKEAAKAFLVQLLPVGTVVSLTSVRTDKYQPRYNAVLTLPDGRNVGDLLVAAKHARPWKGYGPKPWSLSPSLKTHALRVVDAP